MLAKKFSQNFLFQIASQAIGFIASIFVARLGGAAIFGNIGLATSYQNLFRSLIVNSTNNAHLKIYSEDNECGIRTYTQLTFLMIVFSDLLIFAWVVYNYFSFDSSLSTLQCTLILLFILQDFITFPCLVANVDCASKLDIFRANMSSFIPALLSNIFKVLAVVLGYREIGIAIFLLIASFFGTFYSIYLLQKNADWGIFRKDLLKKYIRYTMFIMAGAVAHGLLQSYDKILLGFLRVSPEDIGYYNAGNKLGLLFLQIGVSVGGIFLAVFSRNVVQKDNDSTLDQLKKYERYVLIFFLPCIMAVSLLGKDLLMLVFGNDFGRGDGVLIFSLLVALAKIITVPYHNFLFAHNRFKSFNILSLFYSAAIVGITTFFAIVNWFNDILLSIAFGLFLSGIIEKLLFTYVSKKIDSRVKFLYSFPLLFYFLLIFAASEWILTSFLSQSTFIFRLFFVLIISGITILFGFLFGFYKKEDILLIRNLIRI